MQSFMAVPVDAITCTHGLSHQAQGLARSRRESASASHEKARRREGRRASSCPASALPARLDVGA